MVKYLIIRFSSIGDIVLTTPVVRCLKNQVEGAEIHFLTKKSFQGVLQNNPYIDKVILLDESLNKTIEVLKEEQYDYVIDLHHNLRTLLVKNKLRLISFSFNKLNIEKWLITNLKINRLPKQHIVDRYLETVRLFDITNDQKGLDFYISPEDTIQISSLPVNFQSGYVGFVIGAKHGTKKLPVPKIAEIIKKSNLSAVIIGGKDDMAEGEEIARLTDGLCYNAAGKYNLGQSASLVQQARLIVAHDTGFMHIAAAFKKKIISIWGNTIPEFGMYPYLPDPASEIFEVKNLSCRPCSKIGHKECPKKHFKCMNLQDEEAIVASIKKLWNN